MEPKPLTPENYYRLPWNLADNAITWLEPTFKCNLQCEGCYREKGEHRPLTDVIQELKKAGLVGFTVHVDSHQGRPGWEDQGEAELNELRTKLATVIHEAGQLFALPRVSAGF